MVAGVLVVIHEHLGGVPVLAPPGRGGVLRNAPFHLAGEGQRGAADVAEAPPRLDSHVDVQPGSARGLGPAAGTQLGQHLMGHRGDATHALEVAFRHRVEVDPPLVGPLDISATGVPGMELHGRHLHRPDNAGQVRDTQLVGVAAGREVDTDGVDPIRRSAGKALLMDLLVVDPAREAMEHAWSFAQGADDPIADAHVVARQVELGLAPRREVHAVGV